MSGNAIAQFTKNGRCDSCVIVGANTKSDGSGTIGTDLSLLATAGAEGTFVDSVEIIPTASVAETLTNATVVRLFISTLATGVTSSANTRLLREVSVPAQTASHPTNPTYPIPIPLGIRLKATESLLVSQHVAPAADTALRANLVGAGDY